MKKITKILLSLLMMSSVWTYAENIDNASISDTGVSVTTTEVVNENDIVERSASGDVTFDGNLSENAVVNQGSGSQDFIISKFGFNGTYDGTAPFDADSNAGNDSENKNGIVRSFDKIVYRTSYSTEALNDNHLYSGEFYFDMTLPTSENIATWDLEAMDWMKDTKYTNENGVQRLTGKFTVKDELIAPRVGILNFVVSVEGANNGDIVKSPTFRISNNGKDWAEVTADKDVTVSAKANIDASITHLSGDRTFGKWGVLLTMRANAIGKGIKGNQLLKDNSDINIGLSIDNGRSFKSVMLNDGTAPLLPFDDGATTEETTFNKVYNGGTPTLEGGNLKISGLKLDPLFFKKKVTHASNVQSATAGASFDNDVFPIGAYVLEVDNNGLPNSNIIINARITSATAMSVTNEEATDSIPTNNTATQGLSPFIPVNGGNSAKGPGLMRSSATVYVPGTLKAVDHTWWEGTLSGGNQRMGRVYPGELVATAWQYMQHYDYMPAWTPKKLEVFYKMDGNMFEFIEPSSPDYRSISGGMTVDRQPAISEEVYYVVKKDGQAFANDNEMKDARINNGQFELHKTYEGTIGKKLIGFYRVYTLSSYTPNSVFLYLPSSPMVRAKADALLDQDGNLKPKSDPSRVGMFLIDVVFTHQNGYVSKRFTTSGVSTDVDGYDVTRPEIFYNLLKPTFDNNGNITANARLNGNGRTNNQPRSTIGGTSVFLEDFSTFLNLNVVNKITNKKGEIVTKEVYNLDERERIVTFEVDAGTQSGRHFPLNNDTGHITVTLPEGVNKPEGGWNVRYGGTVGETTDTGVVINGASDVFENSDTAVSVKNDTATWNTTPMSANFTESYENGEWVLKWDISGYPTTYEYPNIYFDAFLGDENDITKEVSNGSKLPVTATYKTDRLNREKAKTVGVTTIKTGSATILKTARPLQRTSNEFNYDIEFKATDIHADTYTDAVILDILPYNDAHLGADAINKDIRLGEFKPYLTMLTGGIKDYNPKDSINPVLTLYYTKENPDTVRTDAGGLTTLATNGVGSIYDFSQAYWQSVNIPLVNSGVNNGFLIPRKDAINLIPQDATAFGFKLENISVGSQLKTTLTYIDENNKEKDNKHIFTNKVFMGIGKDTYEKTTSLAKNLPNNSKVLKEVNGEEYIDGTPLSSFDTDLEYSITWTNTTNRKMDIKVTDTMENGYFKDSEIEPISLVETGTGFEVEWEIKNVLPMETVVINYIVEKTQDTKKIENAVKVKDGFNNPIISEVVDNEVIPPTEGYKLTVNKYSDPAPNTLVTNGQDITYILKVKNTGKDVVPYSLVRDSIPKYMTFKSTNDGEFNANGNFVDFILKDMQPNEVREVKFIATVDNDASDVTKFVINRATYDVFNDEPSLKNRQKDETPLKRETNTIIHPLDKDTPTPPVLDGIKSSTPASGSMVISGEEVEYSIAITNNGGKPAKKVLVVDNIPATTTFLSVDTEHNGRYDDVNNRVMFVIDELLPSETKTVKFKVTVDPTEDGRSIENQARYENGWKDFFEDGTPKINRIPNNSTNVVEHYLPTPPKYTGEKSSTPSTNETVRRGQDITYKILFSNKGEYDLPFATVRDYIPAGTKFKAVKNNGVYDAGKNYVEWDLTDIKVGEGKLVEFVVTVEDELEVKEIVNEALIEGSYRPIPKDRDPKDKTNKITHNIKEPKVVIFKDSKPTPKSTVERGQEIEYILTVKNTGEDVANFIHVRDYVPTGTTFKSADNEGKLTDKAVDWKILKLKEGESKELRFVVTVDANTTLKTIKNVALVQPYERVPKDELPKLPNPNTPSNEIEHNIVYPKIEAEKSSNPKTDTVVEKGQEITYSIKLKNVGKSVAKYTVVKDYIPKGTTYVSSENGIYDESSKSVIFIVEDIKENDSKTVSFKVKVDSDTTLKEIENVALFEYIENNEKPDGNKYKGGNDPKGKTNKVRHVLKETPTPTPNSTPSPKVKTGVSGISLGIGITAIIIGSAMIVFVIKKKRER